MNIVFQVGTLNVFHYHVLNAMLFANIINANDMRIVKLSGRHGFSFKATFGTRIIAQVQAQQLDRNIAIQHQIVSQVDIGHAALTQRFDYFIPVIKLISGFH